MLIKLVCYGKLTIILVAVGEGEGDDVVARKHEHHQESYAVPNRFHACKVKKTN